MIDILGAVYDFVRAYAWRNNDIPQYEPDQILRGWQNSGTLPASTTEFCVITLVKSIRHGKPVSRPLVTDDEYTDQILTLTEHHLQIDMCSAEPYVMPQLTKARCELLNAICHTRHAAYFFQGISSDLNIMYAEDVQSAAFFDTDKLYTARYFFQLHISEVMHSNFIPEPSFNYVRIATPHAGQIMAGVENTDARHKIS